jgi:hypothetical protein
MKNGNLYYANAFKRSKQKTPNWCFAAASKIVRSYFLKEKVSQADIVREYQGKRGEIGLENMSKVDIKANYPGGGEEQWGEILVHESTFVYPGAGQELEQSVREMLKRNLGADVIVPVGYGGHCIIVSHYDAETDMIRYWDPLKGTDIEWTPLALLFMEMAEFRDFYAFKDLI